MDLIKKKNIITITKTWLMIWWTIKITIISPLKSYQHSNWYFDIGYYFNSNQKRWLFNLCCCFWYLEILPFISLKKSRKKHIFHLSWVKLELGLIIILKCLSLSINIWKGVFSIFSIESNRKSISIDKI